MTALKNLGDLDWSSDVDFERPAEEFCLVHVVHCRSRIRHVLVLNKRKAPVSLRLKIERNRYILNLYKYQIKKIMDDFMTSLFLLKLFAKTFTEISECVAL